ncbi:hypothetical protein [Parafilimonas sp.]|uniref:hypothetical protein n=1 Tax=Parafilimonas sp. TaxID=1969739 RepID=UPI0039E3E3BB
MGKKILAIYYSQTGQLKEIIANFCKPLIEAGHDIDEVQIHMQHEFPFPWATKSFFSVMPDCVLAKPAPLQPFSLQYDKYDLIVLGYQPWFLSASIPFNSLMHDESFLKVIANTPVITITGVRNMWTNAFEKIKLMLINAKARHVGTIALFDRHLNLVSIFTIFHWLVGGRKTRYLGFFPLPGVSDKDIAHTENFGKLALPYLEKNEWNGLLQEFINVKAVDPKYHLMFIESKAGIMFKLWANHISKKENKSFWLAAFKYYLLIALFIAAPVVWVINTLLFKPFLSKHIRRKKEMLLKLN